MQSKYVRMQPLHGREHKRFGVCLGLRGKRVRVRMRLSTGERGRIKQNPSVGYQTDSDTLARPVS
jgi:hypothetical protein